MKFKSKNARNFKVKNPSKPIILPICEFYTGVRQRGYTFAHM